MAGPGHGRLLFRRSGAGDCAGDNHQPRQGRQRDFFVGTQRLKTRRPAFTLGPSLDPRHGPLALPLNRPTPPEWIRGRRQASSATVSQFVALARDVRLRPGNQGEPGYLQPQPGGPVRIWRRASGRPGYSPYGGHDPRTGVWFGDGQGRCGGRYSRGPSSGKAPSGSAPPHLTVKGPSSSTPRSAAITGGYQAGGHQPWAADRSRRSFINRPDGPPSNVDDQPGRRSRHQG